MVRALLAGQKTMTRRLAWRQTVATPTRPRPTAEHRADGYAYYPTPWQRVKVGDRLWVRENFWITEVEGQGIEVPHLVYDEEWVRRQYLEPAPAELRDGSRFPKFGHHPSIHMPRWASRITIVITATKVEPLQEISREDAISEGCEFYIPGHGWITRGELHADPGYSNFLSPKMGFEDIWTSLHGPESWRSNPEVVALAGRVILANIDSDE